MVLSLLLVAVSCKLTGDGAKRVCRQNPTRAVCTCEGETFDTASNGDPVPRCNPDTVQVAAQTTSGAICCLDPTVESEKNCSCAAVVCVQHPSGGDCECAFYTAPNATPGDTVVATCAAPKGGHLCAGADGKSCRATTQACTGGGSIAQCDAATLVSDTSQFCKDALLSQHAHVATDCTAP